MARHSNAQVAHLYAHNVDTRGEAQSHNGNFSFHGPIAYSYSTPIANMIPGADGRPVCLITSHSYSVTTNGKHIRPLHRATDNGHSFIRTFVVPFIGAFGGQNRGDLNVRPWTGADIDRAALALTHKGNLEHFAAEYSDTVKSLPRKTSWDINMLYVLSELRRWRDASNGYCDAFGLNRPTFDVASDAGAIIAKIEARRTPEAIAKRERDAAKRKAAADAKAARETAARIERQSSARAAFYAGERGCTYGLRDETGGALLRVIGGNGNGDGRGPLLQTSLGAEVPLDHAIKVFRFVKLCRERGEAWHRNGRCIRVGAFQVDRIAADGDFWAGCHRINWPEVERLADKLGLLDAAPSDAAVTSAH